MPSFPFFRSLPLLELHIGLSVLLPQDTKLEQV